VTEQELTKNAARRLAIFRHAEEVTGSDAKLPVLRDQPDLLRQVVAAHEAEGESGLRDSSRRPKTSPRVCEFITQRAWRDPNPQPSDP
jgi:hypothetical protein